MDGLKELRRGLILKGWCRKSDIAKFVPCSPQTARKIYDHIQQEVKADGFEILNQCVRTDRLMDYIGLNKKDYL